MLPRLQEKGRFGAAALDEFVVCINIIKSTRSGHESNSTVLLERPIMEALWADSCHARSWKLALVKAN